MEEDPRYIFLNSFYKLSKVQIALLQRTPVHTRKYTIINDQHTRMDTQIE